MLELLLEERPAVISFHFGLPPQAVIDAFKGRGIVLLGGATDVNEARQIAAAGLDGIIAQGYEAGGHRGVFDPANGDPAGADPARADPAIGTFALVQLIARATPLPVIAAGGIMDGRGIAAALLLGASAAQLGTAFLLTPESNAGAGYRALLKSERALRTRTTSAISGRAARSIVNRYVEQVDGAGAPAAPDYPVAYDAGKRLHAAALATGSFEFGATWAGQAAYLVREMGTAELMATLAGELQQTGV
jgi:nitronate monooxygenase